MQTESNFPLEKIIITEDRQRRTFSQDELVKLGKSIKEKQLLNAIVLRSPADPTLVAGERRLKCVSALAKKGVAIRHNMLEVPLGFIPVKFAGDLSKLELEELELDENLCRTDLTWAEETAAVARLQALRQAQAEANPETAEKPTLASLAVETKQTKDVVSHQLMVARHLSDPDVAKAKSLKDAKKIIDKKFEAQRRQELADKVVLQKDCPHQFFQGDCREFVKTLKANLVSAIITDPPYGIDMHKDQSWDGTYHEYNDTEEYAFELIHDLMPEWIRVTKQQAHLYIFCDFSKFEALKTIVESYKDEEGNTIFSCMLYPFIWNKGNIAAYPRPDHWPRKSYECILYAIRGDKKHAKLDLAVIDIPQLQDQPHPAGKPEELYTHLVDRSCAPGDFILDCFAGQGNIFKAAHKRLCFALASELSDKYAPLAKLAYSEVVREV